MATVHYSQATDRNEDFTAISRNRAGSRAGQPETSKLWVSLDIVTVLVASVLSWVIFRSMHGSSGVFAWRLDGTLANTGRMLMVPLGVFVVSLILVSRHLHLYSPDRINGHLHEQRLTVQACLTAGLLVLGTMYLVPHSGGFARPSVDPACSYHEPPVPAPLYPSLRIAKAPFGRAGQPAHPGGRFAS